MLLTVNTQQCSISVNLKLPSCSRLTAPPNDPRASRQQIAAILMESLLSFLRDARVIFAAHQRSSSAVGLLIVLLCPLSCVHWPADDILPRTQKLHTFKL
ncbi:uncharacterized protein BDV17DRAFT_74197 [Aspergillus undulatus]|uniref:uncharacterized protein n=1 Tax=Aspergillus undulatus TaxID=1810928 RepID=UPI003CCE358C